jgi:hypothetical protein
MFELFLLSLLLVVVALCIPPCRRWALEELKAFSGAVAILCLRLTSQFESELTRDGRMEQRLWREQRLRNLRGLALRSEQKRTAQAKTPAELP